MTKSNRKPSEASSTPQPRIRAIVLLHADDGADYAVQLASMLEQSGIKVWLAAAGSRQATWIDNLTAHFRFADTTVLIASPEALLSHSIAAHLEVIAKRRERFAAIVFDDVQMETLAAGQFGYAWFVTGGELHGHPSPNVAHFLLTFNSKYRKATAPAPTQLRRGKAQPLNEGKLILVGRGEVGKTSLVKRLVSNAFSGDESKTQGINITNWPLRCAKTTFRMNIWDFGGQEIMHATHQFFLTERSLYLLVLNGREGGEDLDAEYWLKHIEGFGAESPIIVVLNKINQHPFDLNYRGLRGRYPQIREFVKTDCSTQVGLVELRTAIQNAVQNMPEVRMKFPSDWFAVKERLESMNEEFMSYEQFRQMSVEQGVADDVDRDTLAAVLHCLGIALNYRDDSRLRETSVLKPEWVTQGIYSILNAPELAKRQGELHLKDLGQILPQDRYPVDKHLFLLELMRKFSLCFPFPDDPDHYLIPELLGKEEPEETLDFVPTDCLNFEYHYGVLPEGLLPRFVVRSHTLSRGHARWRSGAILSYEECKALVTAVSSERRVIIRVKDGDAATRRTLLAIIRYDFDRIHAEFKDRLDAQAKVPLTLDPSFAVDYGKLVTLEKQGITTFPEVIGHTVINVDVAALLNGVDLQGQRDTGPTGVVQPKAIFFSYSHKDEALRDELETHLKLLQRLGVIVAWHDRKIVPGQEWDGEIDVRLETADIILLLVSADFLASDYCWGNEVKRAMERHESRDATVIPIMLRPCDWKGTPFAKLQGLPKDMTPVTAFPDHDAAWTTVAKAIRSVAEHGSEGDR